MELVDYKNPRYPYELSTGILLEDRPEGASDDEVLIKVSKGIVKVRKADVKPAKGTHFIIGVNYSGGLYSVALGVEVPHFKLIARKRPWVKPTGLVAWVSKEPVGLTLEEVNQTLADWEFYGVDLVTIPCEDFINKTGVYSEIEELKKNCRQPMPNHPTYSKGFFDQLLELTGQKDITDSTLFNHFRHVHGYLKYSGGPARPRAYRNKIYPYEFGYLSKGWTRTGSYITVHVQLKSTQFPKTSYHLSFRSGEAVLSPLKGYGMPSLDASFYEEDGKLILEATFRSIVCLKGVVNLDGTLTEQVFLTPNELCDALDYAEFLKTYDPNAYSQL